MLRVWERRYGFPTPGATPTANAERLYAPVQVRPAPPWQTDEPR